MYFRSLARSETEKEKLLLTYQVNEDIVRGRFPLNRDLAVELAALMAQVMVCGLAPPSGEDTGGVNSCTTTDNTFASDRFADAFC